MRNKIAIHIALFLASFIFASSYPAYAIYGLKDGRVHFAVVRFTPVDSYVDRKPNNDIFQLTIDSHAAFSQPFYLSEPDSGYVDLDTYYFKIIKRFQDSWLLLRSPYTGGDFFAMQISQLWPFIPKEVEFRRDIELTFDNVYPDTIITIKGISEDMFEVLAMDLWDKVKNTNIPNIIASKGKFIVYGFTIFNSAYQEIHRYLILQSVPEFPEDMIIAGMERPLDMMTANVPVTPEVRLLNLGNESKGNSVRLEIANWNGMLYVDEVASGDVAQDSFGIVCFEPFIHPEPDSLEFRLYLSSSASADAALTRSVEVVLDPVFRGYSVWDKTGGDFPPNARLYGPDNDGVYDIMTRIGSWEIPEYFRNKGDGIFYSYSNNFTQEDLNEKWENGIEYKLRIWTYGDINNDGLIDSVTTLTHPPEVYLRQESGELHLGPGVFRLVSGAQSAVIFDYDQDGINDILFMGILPVILLHGEGDLQFTDVTSEVGALPRALLGDAGDLNGDGYPDMVLKDYTEILVMINQGGKSFINRSLLLTTRHKYIGFEIRSTDYYMGIIDIDGDGDNDIFGEHFYFANLGFNPIPTGIEEEENIPAIPSKYELHAAYPNPFNPTTTIRFDLPEAGDVRITIYNVLGQRVAEPVNENVPAGSHQRVWDGTLFSSGIYLVRMEAKDFSKTTKITLLK